MLTEQQKTAAELFVMRDVNKMTVRQIADEVGISERQLYRWKQNNKDYIQYQNELSENIMDDFLTEAYVIIREIMRTAQTEGNKIKAAELVLKNRGKLKQVHQMDVDMEIKSRSNEELEAEIDDMLSRINL